MPAPLLLPGDPAPVAVDNPNGHGRFMLVGDHAGRAVPRALGDLGLPPEQLDRHIAYDIGALGLGRELARLLDSPFVHQAYSRLVIDCNREPGAESSIAQVSDGVSIPTNTGLSPGEAAARRREIFEPYHARIGALLQQAASAGRAPILLAVHSFTPRLGGGQPRPWRFGVVHHGASPFSSAMLEALNKAYGSEVVGDNLPYGMDGNDYTIPCHAIDQGIDYLELEVRQDTITGAADQAKAAAELAGIIETALGELDRRGE